MLTILQGGHMITSEEQKFAQIQCSPAFSVELQNTSNEAIQTVDAFN